MRTVSRLGRASFFLPFDDVILLIRSFVWTGEILGISQVLHGRYMELIVVSF